MGKLESPGRMVSSSGFRVVEKAKSQLPTWNRSRQHAPGGHDRQTVSPVPR